MEVTGIVTAFMPTLYVIRQAIRRNANLIIAHEGAFFSHHDQEGQGPSKWNTYQEETYRLSKRLCGITSICFVLRQKVHIKGFSFQKNNRAYEQNRAVENDRIYGDPLRWRNRAWKGSETTYPLFLNSWTLVRRAQRG